MADTQTPQGPDTGAENSLGPVRRRRGAGRVGQADAAPPPAKGRAKAANGLGSAASTSADAKPSVAPASKLVRTVPEEVRQRFVQMKNEYYFPDGARAFTDWGKRLTTPSENTEVVRSLVLIAEARGWTEITVRGTERFRREAWNAAQQVGMEVRGYQPTEFEQARAVRAQARRQPDTAEDRVAEGRSSYETDARRSRGKRDVEGMLLTGRLVDHGRATYNHDPKAAMSYFVKIETPRGDRMVWGVDLERAFKESLTKPEAGDEVGLRTVRIDAVKVRQQAHNEAGQVVERDLETHRNRWVIEKRPFFEARAEAARAVRDPSIDAKQAVKKHPELVGTLLQVKYAELAAKSIRDPQDRALFVSKVRSALADSVARGEPLPAVRLRERAAAAPDRGPKAPERDSAPTR